MYKEGDFRSSEHTNNPSPAIPKHQGTNPDNCPIGPSIPNKLHEQLFFEEAKTEEQRLFASICLGRITYHLRESDRLVSEVSQEKLKALFHQERIAMNAQWGDVVFADFNMVHVLGATKRAVYEYKKDHKIDNDVGGLHDVQLRSYRSLQDLFERILHRTPEEECIIREIEHEAFKTAPHELTRLRRGQRADIVLPDMAEGYQRDFCLEFMNALREQVNKISQSFTNFPNTQAASEPLQHKGNEQIDVNRLLKTHQNRESVADYTLGNVFAEIRRELLYAYYYRDKNEASQAHFDDTLAVYQMVRSAMTSDTDTGSDSNPGSVQESS